jgi:ribonuclease HI
VKKQATCYFDGGCRGNPGVAGCAIVMLVSNDPSRPIERTKLLPDPATNNEAEYQGLLLGLRTGIAYGVFDIQLVSDSKLIVEQVLGAWQVKEPRLKILCAEAQELATAYEHSELLHVPREQNKDADALVTKLLDDATGVKRQ